MGDLDRAGELLAEDDRLAQAATSTEHVLGAGLSRCIWPGKAVISR